MSGCEMEGCGGPRDTIKRVDGVTRVVCYKCAGPIETPVPERDAADFDRVEEEVERLRRQEEEEAKRLIEEPEPPRPRRDREVKCVDCGTVLEGLQRKRCPPCGREHQREYFRNYMRSRNQRLRSQS